MNTLFERLEEQADIFGSILVRAFHLLALFAIGAATVWSAAFAFFDMVKAGRAGISDILLLFIYLELGAMVGIYFKTNRMPTRFLIYVAITALTRLLIEVISVTHEANLNVIMISGAILLLSFAVLVLRYGSVHLPIEYGPEEMADRPQRKENNIARKTGGKSR